MRLAAEITSQTDVWSVSGPRLRPSSSLSQLAARTASAAHEPLRLDGRQNDREHAPCPRLPLGEVRCAGGDLRPRFLSFGVANEVRINAVLSVADLNAALASCPEVQEPLWDCLGAAHPRPDEKVAAVVVKVGDRDGMAVPLWRPGTVSSSSGSRPIPRPPTRPFVPGTTRRSPWSLLERLSWLQDSSRPPAQIQFWAAEEAETITGSAAHGRTTTWCSPRESGTPVDASHVRRSFRTVAAAGLDPHEWTPRELRHSFVSLLSDADVPIEHISRLVGHSSTTTTETVYRR